MYPYTEMHHSYVNFVPCCIYITCMPLYPYVRSITIHIILCNLCYGERRNPHARISSLHLYISLPQLFYLLYSTDRPQKLHIISHFSLFLKKNPLQQFQFVFSSRPLNNTHHLILQSHSSSSTSSYLTYQVQTCSFFFPSSPPLGGPTPPHPPSPPPSPATQFRPSITFPLSQQLHLRPKPFRLQR